MDAAKDPDIEETGTYTHYQVSEQALGVSKDSVDFEARKIYLDELLGQDMDMSGEKTLTEQEDGFKKVKDKLLSKYTFSYIENSDSDFDRAKALRVWISKRIGSIRHQNKHPKGPKRKVKKERKPGLRRKANMQKTVANNHQLPTPPPSQSEASTTEVPKVGETFITSSLSNMSIISSRVHTPSLDSARSLRALSVSTSVTRAESPHNTDIDMEVDSSTLHPPEHRAVEAKRIDQMPIIPTLPTHSLNAPFDHELFTMSEAYPDLYRFLSSCVPDVSFHIYDFVADGCIGGAYLRAIASWPEEKIEKTVAEIVPGISRMDRRVLLQGFAALAAGTMQI